MAVRITSELEEKPILRDALPERCEIKGAIRAPCGCAKLMLTLSQIRTALGSNVPAGRFVGLGPQPGKLNPKSVS
jgi:hypothetical protein